MSRTQPDLTEFALFANRLAEAARGQTLPRFRGGAEVFNKAPGDFDPVTDADREAERVQRELIRNTYPAHGLVGEEFGVENSTARWRWVLDPVDGTRAFVCGVASWATLIALEEGGRPVLGLIDQPFVGERWTAFDGVTVYMRGDAASRCRTSGVECLSEARISTTDPRPLFHFNEAEAGAFLQIAEEARLARFSLDAYAYGLLASGEIDLVIESGLQHHDFAALIPVVECAGGVVTNWEGGPVSDDLRGRIVAAASQDLHSAALERLRDL